MIRPIECFIWRNGTVAAVEEHSPLYTGEICWYRLGKWAHWSTGDTSIRHVAGLGTALRCAWHRDRSLLGSVNRCATS